MATAAQAIFGRADFLERFHTGTEHHRDDRERALEPAVAATSTPED